MKTKHIALLAATTALFTASAARASLYDITFTGGGWTASGQVDVIGGVADTGFLDVTYGSTTVAYNYLAIGPIGGVVSDDNGDNLPYTDNQVNVVSSPIVDQSGLLFLTAPDVGGHSAGSGMYFSADQFNNDQPNLNGYGHEFGYGVPNVDGTATIAVAVPEPSTFPFGFAALIPIGVAGARRFVQHRS